MELLPDRPRPDLYLQAQSSRNKGISLPEIHAGNLKQFGLRLALGLLVAAAGTGLKPSSSSADGEVYQDPGQASAADIKRCDLETEILALCFKTSDPDNSDPVLEERYLFRRFMAVREVPIDRAICPDGAMNPPGRHEYCEDPAGNLVPGATVADLVDPERASRFASSLAVPTEQTVGEPAPAPSPEPVADPPTEPPIQSAPADCPPFGAPLGGSGILTNPRIARDNMIDWAKGSPLENITNVPKNSGRVHRFVDFNMNPGGKFNVSSFKCLGGTWRFAGTSETHTTGNRTGSWSFPFIIRDPEVAKGTWTAVWQADDPNTPEVDFKVVLQQNFRIVD